MAFKRSAVRSRLSPPKVLKTIGFQHFFLFRCFFGWIFRPLEYSANLSHSRGVVMARISMRNVQKSPVSEYFDLFLSSAAARGVKDKTLSTYKQHFHSISKRLAATLPLNRLNTAELDKMVRLCGFQGKCQQIQLRRAYYLTKLFLSETAPSF